MQQHTRTVQVYIYVSINTHDVLSAEKEKNWYIYIKASISVEGGHFYRAFFLPPKG